MGLIFAAAAAAAAALFAYNRAHDDHPVEADQTVRGMRQATGVLGAIVNAVIAVLDALQMLTRPRVQVSTAGNGGGGAVSPPFGSQRGTEE